LIKADSMNENFSKFVTCIAYDIVNSSAGGHLRHDKQLQAAEDAFTDAIATSADPAGWIRSNRGDGEVTLAPISVHPGWLLARFLPDLHESLVRYNQDKNDAYKVRIRVGVTCGEVQIGDDGPRGGRPLVDAARLRDSDAAYEATTAVPSATVVALISDAVYARTVTEHVMSLEARRFRRVVTHSKNDEVAGYLYVPHHEPPMVPGADPNPASAPKPAAAPSPAAASVPTSPNPTAAGTWSKYQTSVTGGQGIIVGDNANQTNDHRTQINRGRS
jgi:hypothetical protein